MKKVLLFALLVVAVQVASRNREIVEGRQPLPWYRPFRSHHTYPNQYLNNTSGNKTASESGIQVSPDNPQNTNGTENGVDEAQSKDPKEDRRHHRRRFHHRYPSYSSWGSQNSDSNSDITGWNITQSKSGETSPDNPHNKDVTESGVNQDQSSKLKEGRQESKYTHRGIPYYRHHRRFHNRYPYSSWRSQNSDSYSENPGWNKTESKSSVISPDNPENSNNSVSGVDQELTSEPGKDRQESNSRVGHHPRSWFNRHPEPYSDNPEINERDQENSQNTNGTEIGIDDCSEPSEEDGQDSSDQMYTPSLHEVMACLQLCPMTSEINPICGTDDITYRNPGRLLCSQFCGLDVRVKKFLACSTSADFSSEPTTEFDHVNVISHITPPIEACLESCPYAPNLFEKFICGSDPLTFNIVKINKCESFCGFEQPFLTDCIPTSDEMELSVDITTLREKTERKPKPPPSSMEYTTVPDKKTVVCKSICFLTSEKQPVCGTNNMTYWNMEMLECAKRCGIAVEFKSFAPCSSPHVFGKQKYNLVIHINKGSNPETKNDSRSSTESNTMKSNINLKPIVAEDPDQPILDDVLNNIFQSNNTDDKKARFSIEDQYQETPEKQKANLMDGSGSNFTIPDDALKNMLQLNEKANLSIPNQATQNNEQDANTIDYNGFGFTIPDDVLEQIFGSKRKDSNDDVVDDDVDKGSGSDFTIPDDALKNSFQLNEKANLSIPNQATQNNEQDANTIDDSGLGFTIPDDVLEQIFGSKRKDSNDDVSIISFLPDQEQPVTKRDPVAYDIDVRFSNDK